VAEVQREARAWPTYTSVNRQLKGLGPYKPLTKSISEVTSYSIALK
jgi:hypothetical protein